MINYSMGRWGLRFVFRCTGSVFPKACLIALPNAALTVLLHFFGRQEQDGDNVLNMTGLNKAWSGYTAVLSLLLVFRNNQAYTRFWEGATLMNQVRSEWTNMITTLFAFCNHSEDFQQSVEDFQHNLIRLSSLLYCSALQQVCDLGNDRLEVLEFEGLSEDGRRFLEISNDRCEIIMLWIQRLMVDASEAHTIKISPPLLTRAYQELASGMVHLNNARKIKDIPFPFPYAQLITCMLMAHWVATPLIASDVMSSVAVSACFSFASTFVIWCMVFITMEIDQPFGEDPNDLPLHEMQKDFNRSLVTLMHPMAQKVPTHDGRLSAKPASHAAVAPVGRTLMEKFSAETAPRSASELRRMQTMADICAVAAPSLRCSDDGDTDSKKDPPRRLIWPCSTRNSPGSVGAEDVAGRRPFWRSGTMETTSTANTERRPFRRTGTMRSTSSASTEREVDLGEHVDPEGMPNLGAVVLLGRASADPEAGQRAEKHGPLEPETVPTRL